MKNILLKLFGIFSVVFSIFFITTDFSYAQNPTCDVIDAKIRTNIVINNPNGDDDSNGETNWEEAFMIDNQPPYVYFDIKTTGCLDNNLDWDMEISLTREGFPDVDEAITQLNDWNFDVPDNDFTIVYTAGEVTCGQIYEPDCQYHIETWDSNSSAQEWSSLDYDCDYDCDENWSFLGFLPYEQNHQYDNTPINPVPGTTTSTTGINESYLAPLPGLENASSGLQGFLQGLFNIAIVIAGILAILMIVIGAITYLSTDSLSGTEKGRDMMLNAVFGLILALGAWVILNTLNPNLAESLRITIPRVNIGNYNVGSDGVITQQDTGGSPNEGPGAGSICKNPNIDRSPGQCTTCQVLPPTIGITNGAAAGHNQTTPELRNKLLALKQLTDANNINWVVTEAYPPSVTHCGQCHYRGTCIDSDITPQPTPAQIKRYIELAASVGLDADYETGNTQEYNDLINLGLKKKHDVLFFSTWITGSHFSVYDR